MDKRTTNGQANINRPHFFTHLKPTPMNLNEVPKQVSMLSMYNSKKPLHLIEIIICPTCGNKVNMCLPTCYNCERALDDEMKFNEKDLELFKEMPAKHKKFRRGFVSNIINGWCIYAAPY